MDLTPYNLGNMVNEASAKFAESQDLNKEIAKIAEANELTQNQIQAVVEESNHEVFRRLYKTAEDKRFTFKMASTEEVLKLLHPDDSRPKVAELAQVGFSTLKIDSTREKRASEKVAQPIPDWIRDDQARLTETKHNLRVAADELRKHAAHFRQRANFSKLAAMETSQKILDISQQHVLNGTPFQTLYKLAVMQAPELKPALSVIFEDVHKAYTKIASAVEKDLLGFDPESVDGKDEIGTRVINGNNPLFIHITDLLDKCHDQYVTEPLSRHLESTASGLISSIHRLNTPDDVDAYVANESQRFANAVKMGRDEAITAVGILEHSRIAGLEDSEKTAALDQPWLQSIPATLTEARETLKEAGVAKNIMRGAKETVTGAPSRVQALGRGAKAVAKGVSGAKSWASKGKELFLPKGRVYEMMFSPLGFGSGKGSGGAGLAGLSGALYSGSKALQGTGEAAKDVGRAFMSGGERDTGIGLAKG